MKIVFTSFYETFSKENTKNYIPNSYVLVFLISVIFFFLLIILDGRSILVVAIQDTPKHWTNQEILISEVKALKVHHIIKKENDRYSDKMYQENFKTV